MTTHYFTDNDTLEHDYHNIKVIIQDMVFNFQTDAGVFSKFGLDYGSRVLINNALKYELGPKTLDLGCGWGPVGIIVKKIKDTEVWAVDINNRAVQLTSLNAKNNQVVLNVFKCDDLLTLDQRFNTVLFNPPIRSGKDNIFSLYDRVYRVLEDRGNLFIVIQKKQGAKSSFNKLAELFRKVEIIDSDKGYQIIKATK